QSIEQGSNLVFKEIFRSLNLDNLFIKNTNAAIKSDVERAMGTNPTANTEVMIFLGNLKNELSFLNTQSTNPIAEMGKGFVVKPGDFEKEFPTPKTSQDYS
ncbi:MAG: hypothetical protein QG567_1821, partial [Campylobacterota bacterium]|nr:hypothetical protein [Campylobacterota bacterium]